jgi:3-methyladenine DNA glycosylase AlkD
MTCDEVMQELETFCNEGTKRVFTNHGAREPVFGVKVGDMKKILKKTKENHELALQLYATGNSDAMYLAGLMAAPNQVTKDELNGWVKQAYWYFLSEYAVAGLAAESPHGLDVARKWITSDEEMVAAAGWATLSGVVAFKENNELDIAEIDTLLDIVEETLHDTKNRVRYTMNGFVIAVGGYIGELSAKAMNVSEKIGKVSVDMGGTACKVPYAPEYIQKMLDRGSASKKRKAIRC